MNRSICIILFILFKLSTKAQNIKFIDIGSVEKEIVVFKFMKYKINKNNIYGRDPILMTPKRKYATNQKHICSNFSYILPISRQSYHQLAWYIKLKDSLNIYDFDVRSYLKILDLSREFPIEISQYPYLPYDINFNDESGYILNKNVLFFVKKIRIKGLLVFFSNIYDYGFYNKYESWDILTGDFCIYDNIFLFITEIKEQSDVSSDYVENIFKKVKKVNSRVFFATEG